MKLTFNHFQKLAVIGIASAGVFSSLPVLAQLTAGMESEAPAAQVEPDKPSTESTDVPEATDAPAEVAPETSQAEPEVVPEEGMTPTAPGMDAASPTTVTTAELQQVINVLPALQAIQESAQQEARLTIEESGLDPARFAELSQAQETPETDLAATGASPEEQESFEVAYAEIEQIRQAAIDQQAQAIEAEGLSPERFNEIIDAIQADPALQQQVEEMLPAE